MEDYLNTVVLSTMPIVAYDEKAAYWYAVERARRTNIELPTPFADGEIAAVTIVNGLPLMTNNTIDYKNYTHLQLENWVEPSPI